MFLTSTEGSVNPNWARNFVPLDLRWSQTWLIGANVEEERKGTAHPLPLLFLPIDANPSWGVSLFKGPRK